MTEKRFIIFFIPAATLLLVILALTLNGTGDSGDSIMHYQYAHYAFAHHDNLFNAWAKPLFVLLAAPFAQMGFTGIKLFNIINTIVAMVATYLIAKKLNLANSWLSPIFLLLAPMSFALSLTGLTEPLFASVLVLGLCLLFYEYTITALIVLSFLPFIRSEGLFLLIPILIYLLIQKRYGSVLWLATGQVFYAVIGYFHFGNLLWFYQSNPYSLISHYGSGDWIHYLLNMPITTGPASCYLLAAGFFTIPFFYFSSRATSLPLILVWVVFSMYFFFHVIAWRFGLFGSFGMVRIIAGVTPLIAIICNYGFNKTEELLKHFFKNTKNIGAYCIAVVLIINLAYMLVRVNGKAGAAGLDLTLNADQLTENKMADYIKTKYPDYKKQQVFFNAPYLSLALDIDPTNVAHNPMATNQDGNYPASSLYVWDDWYSVIEGGITKESLDKNIAMKRDTAFSQTDRTGKLKTVVLYRKL
jgi:hypothetical protein